MKPFLGLLVGTVLAVKENKLKSRRCCSALRDDAALRDKVFDRGSETYWTRLESYWALSAALEPWCMVLPESTSDTSKAMSTLKENECPFGIRSGGHDRYPYSNSVDEGVTIDFGRMVDVKDDETTGIASIEPGNRWGNVYNVLAPHGITVAGGRVGSVGVGGFLTGGGNSYFSNEHGFACDTVENFEVVLADGSIVNANANENTDLWRALRGGSGNFGLVTRFDMRVIKYHEVGPDGAGLQYGGTVSYGSSEATADQLFDAYDRFVEATPEDLHSSVVLEFDQTPGTSDIVPFVMLQNTRNQQDATAFEPFLQEPLTSSIKDINLFSANLTNSTDTPNSAGGARHRHLWLTAGYKHDPRIMSYVRRQQEELIQMLSARLSSDSNFGHYTVWQPLTQAMVKPNNSLGLQWITSTQAGMLFLLGVYYDGQQNDEAALRATKEWQERIDAEAKRLSIFTNWRYLNYAGQDVLQNPIAGYGDEVKGFLTEVSKRYDPDQIFQKLRKSGHKIVVDEYAVFLGGKPAAPRVL